MNSLKKFWALFEDVTAGSLLSTGVLLIFYNVIMRYLFNAPKAWVEEVANYLIVWGALIGISIALRNNHHISIEMLYEKMSPLWKRGVDIFANSMGILFCLLYTYYGFELVIKRFGSGMVSMDVGIPMWIVYLILPISGLLFLLRFIERLINNIMGKEEQHDHNLI
jgi:C4-dicarboxylate transporter DctQ subunit